MVSLHTLCFTLILSNFDEVVCQQKHQHDISRIRWGMELKISSFQTFNSLSCLNTNNLYITLTVTRLHRFTLHGSHCKWFPAWKKSTERFRNCPVTSQSLIVTSNGFYQQVQFFNIELMQFMWLPNSRQLCFLFGKFFKSRINGNREKIDHGMSFLKEGECRSILAKPAD